MPRVRSVDDGDQQKLWRRATRTLLPSYYDDDDDYCGDGSGGSSGSSGGSDIVFVVEQFTS